VYALLAKLLDDIRASYWFVPMCMLITAIALAFITRWLDAESVMSEFAESSVLIASGADGARTILSVIATTVMGVAGVTFSLTIVAVSFASSNFGPRLIGNFMRDRGNQFTLGTFVGTFAYCLLILATVRGESSTEMTASTESFAPYLSLIIALVLALVCIAVLIYYIHHIAETINIENIIADIGRNLTSRIAEIYPDSDAEKTLVDEDSFSAATQHLQPSRISCQSTGYVQAIDHDKLDELTETRQLLTRVHYRPGDFVTPHDSLLSVWSEEADKVPESELRHCFATGPQRTEHQNVLFLVEQLAEVIARALSPGVNDPFTAISCLNWYRLAIPEYINVFPDAVDEKKMVRCIVQVAPIKFERLTSVMFDTTRQYIVSDMNVLLHAMAMIAECASFAGPGQHQQVLKKHLKCFHDAGQQYHKCSIDAQSITERYEQTLIILSNKDGNPQQRYENWWFGGSA